MRCDGCPADPAHACYSLVARLPHFCRLRRHDVGLDGLIAARSAPGPEPDGPATGGAVLEALSLRVDLCDFRATCSCDDLRTCMQSTFPVTVTRADCRACASDESLHP